MIFIIVAVLWTCNVSPAGEKDTDEREIKRKNAERLQEKAKVKDKTTEKAGSIDKSKTEEPSGKFDSIFSIIQDF